MPSGFFTYPITYGNDIFYLIFKILSQFVLSHEEVVQQRRLEAKRRLDEVSI